MRTGSSKIAAASIVLLLALVGCGGGSGGGETTDTSTDTLSISTHTASPGEIFTLSHPSIRADVPVEVTLDLGGDPVTIAYSPGTDGSLMIALPPLIDPVSGELGGGVVQISLAAADVSATVQVGALPELAAELTPGQVTTLLIDAVLENYSDVLDRLADIRAEANGAIDTTAVEAPIAEVVANLEEMRDEIAQTGELTVEMIDGSLVTLGGADLSAFDRWLLASVQGILTATEASEAGSLWVATRATVQPQSLGRTEITKTEIRALIARQQVVAGLNTRSREIDEAAVNLFLSSTGVPTNIAGRFGNAFGALVATGELVVAMRGSQLSLALTTSALNGERERQKEWNSLLAKLGGFGLSLVAVAGAAVTAPYWLGVAGTMATITGLSVAMTAFSDTVNHSTDIKVHIPASGIEFSEIRVLQAGTFSFPSIGVVMEDADAVSNAYDLHLYGVQGAGDSASWVPETWTVLGVNRAAYKIEYGNSVLGQVNTARGVDGGPPIPATSLEDFSQFGVLATAVDYQLVEGGDPIRTERSFVDIKYIDGPVVFTFEIQEHPELPEPQTDISGHISNGSSLPLSIYRLEFEIEPGKVAFTPLYDQPAPLVTVEPGGTQRFQLPDVTIKTEASLTGVPKHPRLLINNKGATPLTQQFWSGLRSAPALSGLFTVAPPPPVAPITSTFDDALAEFDDRWGIGSQAPGYGSGWFYSKDVGDYRSSGGNPGGRLSWLGDQGDWWFFTTYSSKYSGDRSFAYGKQLSFDLRTDYKFPLYATTIPFVVLSGTDANGGTLHLYQKQSDHSKPGTDWTHYSIPLHESSPWYRSSASNLSSEGAATGADIRQVLSTLTSLRIRGEYGGWRYRGDLDNVTLGAP